MKETEVGKEKNQTKNINCLVGLAVIIVLGFLFGTTEQKQQQ